MSSIYILELEHSKYYVGLSNNPEERIAAHFNNRGSAWTREHKPIKLYELHRDADYADENNFTLKMMDKFGIDNVRGGSYCRMEMSAEEKRFARRAFAAQQNACLACFFHGHFANACTAKLDKFGESILLLDNRPTSINNKRDLPIVEGEEVAPTKKSKLQCCSRCGRESHYWKGCYAKYDIDGAILSVPAHSYEEDKCYADGTRLETQQNNPAFKIQSMNQFAASEVPKFVRCVTAPTSPIKKTLQCSFGCGRDSHNSKGCFVKYDIDRAILSSIRCGRCGGDHKEDKCYAENDPVTETRAVEWGILIQERVVFQKDYIKTGEKASHRILF